MVKADISVYEARVEPRLLEYCQGTEGSMKLVPYVKIHPPTPTEDLSLGGSNQHYLQKKHYVIAQNNPFSFYLLEDFVTT